MACHAIATRLLLYTLPAHVASNRHALINEREYMFSRRLIWMLAAGPLALGCSKSWPEPKQPLADAEAAARSAREVGAEDQPAAKLKVTLADEQIADAKASIQK